MKEIKIVNSHIFTIDGVPYGRLYQPIRMGENHLGIYNVYDSRQQILGSTRYDNIKVGGQTFSSLNELLEELVPVLFSPSPSGTGIGGTDGQHFRVIDINLYGTGTERQRVANAINNKSPFTIKKDEVVLFRIVSAPTLQQIVQVSQNISVLETFYIVEGMGAGEYGVGNTQVSVNNTTKLTQTSATATEISFGNIGFQSPWNYGNENGSWHISGLTIIETIQEGVEFTYLFTGQPGTYGQNATEFEETHFQILGQNEVTLISDGLPPRRIEESRDITVADLNRLLEVAQEDIILTIPETLYDEIDSEGLTSVYFRVEWQETGGKLTFENKEGDIVTASFTKGDYIQVEKRLNDKGYIVKTWGGDGTGGSPIGQGDGILINSGIISIDAPWLRNDLDNYGYLTETVADTLYQKEDEAIEYIAGENIVIGQDNSINATDTRYLAGTGIKISPANIISLATEGQVGENIFEILANEGVRISNRNTPNKGTLGENAFDVSVANQGSNLGATGNVSTAIGYNVMASGTASTAIGYEVKARGISSLAMGRQSDAIGLYSIAIGEEASAGGQNSISIGRKTKANGAWSLAMGNDTLASANYSTAIGQTTEALADYSFAANNTTIASGKASTSLGTKTVAWAHSSLAIGRYNTIKESDGEWHPGQPLLQIGNGDREEERNDAFVVYNDGNAELDGDLELKKNNSGVIVKSESGKRWKIKVDEEGKILVEEA